MTTTYKIRTKYYENMRPNKQKESPKTNLEESFLQSNSFALKRPSLSIFLDIVQGMQQKQLVLWNLLVQVQGQIWYQNILEAMQYFVKQYIQLKTKFKDRASYISFWLRATYIQSALAVFTLSNIIQQTRGPMIINILLIKIIGILMMLEKYLLESECVSFNK